ncbi:transporter substrate-binding domain-containing protein [Shewanella insulae]|uniref:substrate-binding periplasmic protein n=1 Tax=Shewanella insulae TaxID=2681496 RepID=UPI001EFD1C18|nr:transporter substrate-binding domain-containing protein [Shewanella insulae]MCG9713699.1 transporter substrate-binding domain-containing protein [Shewanella insulae]
MRRFSMMMWGTSLPCQCITLCLCISLGISMTAPAEAADIRYNLSTHFVDPKQSYYIDLLRLAMEKSRDQYGDYRLLPVEMDMPQGRTIKLVEQGKLDVVWTMTSISREQQLRAVYFPLLKGLMGHRIAIIRKEDELRFANITTIEQLQAIPVGQGSDWPDSDILQHQGFTLVRGAARNLLNMLEKRRFDYFLRALHEPWDEIADKASLVVDNHFVIVYPAPLYFFVAPDNLALAQRIEYGLRAALNDGSFDELFYHHAITEGMLGRAKLTDRRVFHLDNPFMSKTSKNLLSEPELWFD